MLELNKIYYFLLIISILFLIYTFINLILSIKFVNSLSLMLKEKYLNEIKTPKTVFIVSFILLLVSLVIPVIIVKFLLLIITMILNTYSLSEISFLKDYI